MMSFKTVYVTGAPAAGKSSTMRLLERRVGGIQIWEYGERLTRYIQEKGVALTDQTELREKSAQVVGPEDIAALDKQLVTWTRTTRKTAHAVIDSHPVTKEAYGFRVTAFSKEKIAQLQPDEIWLFYASPEVTIDRIRKKADGRPIITIEEARMHTSSQAAVATTYGILCGCPVYMVDTDRDQAELINMLAGRLA